MLQPVKSIANVSAAGLSIPSQDPQVLGSHVPPGKSKFACSACGRQRDILDSVRPTEHTAPVFVVVRRPLDKRRLTLHDVTVVPEGLVFQLRADKEAMQSGFADNLIIEAFRKFTPKQKDGKPSNQKRRYSMGVLPAIPIEIVQR